MLPIERKWDYGRRKHQHASDGHLQEKRLGRLDDPRISFDVYPRAEAQRRRRDERKEDVPQHDASPDVILVHDELREDYGELQHLQKRRAEDGFRNLSALGQFQQNVDALLSHVERQLADQSVHVPPVHQVELHRQGVPDDQRQVTVRVDEIPPLVWEVHGPAAHGDDRVDFLLREFVHDFDRGFLGVEAILPRVLDLIPFRTA
mmetsp:Transcript_26886/g.57169  ORF Transcript_26886/g.57169 Transcript_26886/m.57169 type:complete len:204 (-) Transcript_26886:551-1162(-)